MGNTPCSEKTGEEACFRSKGEEISMGYIRHLNGGNNRGLVEGSEWEQAEGDKGQQGKRVVMEGGQPPLWLPIMKLLGDRDRDTTKHSYPFTSV